ncbi:cache domain-containing protein [Neptunomonas sp. XY-337]|uniref:cache domain-containing protein n=1 Tax=Neptunomonas sp. XY-337 TaxID=2561897 RepID=UPI0010AA7501|nr:cache domain-containing protein [Neptunomonas sp. XY-337]
MLLRSRLVRRFLITVLIVMSAIFATIYFYSVPLLKEKVYEIERNASRIALDSVFSMASKLHTDIELHRKDALDARKQQLKSVVSLAESYLDGLSAAVALGELSQESATTRAFDTLRTLSYGNNDYIWASNYQGTLVAHPDARFDGLSLERLSQYDQAPAISTMVEMAQQQGEGFYRYQWSRLAGEQLLDKVSYFKDIPAWNIVIGSGVYLDDLEQLIKTSHDSVLQELTEGLRDIKIATSGYLFIFDAKTNMLIHPNPNINGTNFWDLVNPLTQQSIADELIRVADTGKELHYTWDRPNDPGNYVYEKLSLVRYLPGFDWYICSSVYVDELRSSSEQLAERLITISAVALTLLTLLIFAFARGITEPIMRLAGTAERVSQGEFTAKSGIHRDDEIGLLARTFDDMVERLRDAIQNLDSKVAERTQALAEKNVELEIASESILLAKVELSKVEERQRLILDALPADILYLDTSLTYLFVNQGYAQRLGLQKEAIIGKHLRPVIGKTQLDQLMPLFEAALAGKTVVHEITSGQGGAVKIEKLTCIPCGSENDQVDGLLLLIFDITNEREVEQKLSEAHRMSAVGQMAGGLAHDFNNLLTIILGNLHAAKDRFATDNEPLADCLRPAIRATRRGADITSRLLSFSRRQPLSPSLVDLGALIEETIQLLHSSLPDNIALEFSQTSLDALPFVDPGRLEDALVNLAFNAKDAMPEGGKIHFSVANRDIDDAPLYDEVVAPGRYVEITVTDTGNGFSETALHQAFEPFFTTKSGGSGSGLGLSMVYGFIKQSRGYIRIENHADQGSCIHLLLPAQTVEALDPVPRDLHTEIENSYQGKLVLLVEDNPDVRKLVRQQLLDMGFDVIDAGSADEAVNLIPLLPELYAMVSDVMLPGERNGIELAQWLKAHNPSSHIILISGYSYQHSKGNLDPDFILLEKPFDSTDLRRAFEQPKRRIPLR